MLNKEKRALYRLNQNKNSNIKKVIAIVSGKGGVGKSFVTSLIASQMQKMGHKTAILDADITGPSIPKAFGLFDGLKSSEIGVEPAISKLGTKIVSTNLLIENTNEALIWRAPVITQTIRQFWLDISWGEVDYMFVDLPPGTSDSQLTVFQSIPLDGIIMVTSPQQLVNSIVVKAIDMAKKTGIPIIGVVENFSYFIAPDTKQKYKIFGDSDTKQILKKYNIEFLDEIPIDPKYSQFVDDGNVEEIDASFLSKTINKIMEFKEDE